jgi:hypothetical protein
MTLVTPSSSSCTAITSSSANSDPVIPAFTERTHLLAPDLLNPLQKPSTIDFKIHKY